jgi:hypothetical protein
MRRPIIASLALIPVLAVSAYAAQVRMVGTTTADSTLARDVMRYVMLIAKAQLNCTNVELIEPEILPSYKPSRVEAEGFAKTTYERWTITLCGKKEQFLVAFWPSAVGGTMFRIGFPFQ